MSDLAVLGGLLLYGILLLIALVTMKIDTYYAEHHKDSQDN